MAQIFGLFRKMLYLFLSHAKNKVISILEQRRQINKVVKSKLFIDENFSDDLTVSMICREAGFSIYHYIRIFKVIYGTTPYRYLKERRIETAKNRLASTGEAVTEICFDCGFDSVSSFSALFKSITGLSPTQYRAEARKRKNELSAQPLRGIPHCLAKKFNFIRE